MPVERIEEAIDAGARALSSSDRDMNPIARLGCWRRCLLVAAWQGYGSTAWRSAVTLIVFWLLLQFNRALRVMRNAGQAPVGHVDSAVMLHSEAARAACRCCRSLTLTKSLGTQARADAERLGLGRRGRRAASS